MAMVEQSLAMVTALAPAIGYEKAAKIAQKAMATGQTTRELAREERVARLSRAGEDSRSLAHDQTGHPGMN